MRGGIAWTTCGRRALSRVANLVADLKLEGRNVEVLEEILIKAYAKGFSVTEVQFTYFPRDRGVSHAKVLCFGVDLSRVSFKLWKLRNSIESAD